MGRRVPNENNITLIDPSLDFAFCMVGLAASIAIISALCSVRFRKKSSSAPAPVSDHDSHEVSNALNESTTLPPITLEATTRSLEHDENPSTMDVTMLENTAKTQNNDTLVKELPLPPALQQHPNVDPKIMKRAASERKLSFNLSKKMPRSFSMARNWEQRGFNDGRKTGKLKTDESLWMKTKGKLKTDDSVWMKTIILGGKCVPDEEDDVVIYEGKGKKISAYHPRNSTSMSLSRQSSFINPGAFSVPLPLRKNQ